MLPHRTSTSPALHILLHYIHQCPLRPSSSLPASICSALFYHEVRLPSSPFLTLLQHLFSLHGSSALSLCDKKRSLPLSETYPHLHRYVIWNSFSVFNIIILFLVTTNILKAGTPPQTGLCTTALYSWESWVEIWKSYYPNWRFAAFWLQLEILSMKIINRKSVMADPAGSNTQWVSFTDGKKQLSL